MDCQYAYMKNDIEYVLCRKEPTPARQDRAAVFHSMCAHQVNCPKLGCQKLSPGWRACRKLIEPAAESAKKRRKKETETEE